MLQFFVRYALCDVFCCVAFEMVGRLNHPPITGASDGQMGEGFSQQTAITTLDED